MGAAGLTVGPLAARTAFPYTTLACVLLIVGAATYVGVCQRGKHHLTHHRAALRAAAGSPLAATDLTCHWVAAREAAGRRGAASNLLDARLWPSSLQRGLAITGSFPIA